MNYLRIQDAYQFSNCSRIDEREDNLSAINSSNDNLRQIRKGSIIKLPVKDVFDEWTATRNGINENYTHILPVTEDDLILVKDVDDDHEDNDPAYITTYFEKKANGEWFPKPYIFTCEFCGLTTDCDRVEYHEDLRDDLEYCLMWGETNPEVTNSTKRKYMYRAHISQKHGRLGAGRRRKPHKCVMKLSVSELITSLLYL